MTTTITCPTCGTVITVEPEPAPVHCACCGREIQGKPLVGWEGELLCGQCSARGPIVAGVGPSEVKGK